MPSSGATRASDLGGTMRLGAYDCHIAPGSQVARHLWRATGSASATATATRSTSTTRSGWRRWACSFSGMSPDGVLPEIVELPDHPWFIGVQFHPELKSKPFDPHPLFTSFIEAAVGSRGWCSAKQAYGAVRSAFSRSSRIQAVEGRMALA